MGLRRVVFVSDVHRPYHDRRAWALLVKVVTELRPEIVVIVGDFVDFASQSHHPPIWGKTYSFELECLDANDGLDELQDAAPKARVIYCQGNHEDRRERNLAENHPEDDRKDQSSRALLKIDARGIDWIPWRKHTKLGKAYITHGIDKRTGKYAVFQLLDLFQGNVVSGHTHRMGVVYGGNAAGVHHVSAMFGWLGDSAEIDYQHQAEVQNHWQLGFGVGYLLPDGVLHLDAIPIINYRCVVEGRLYA